MDTIITLLLYGIAAGFILLLTGVSMQRYASPTDGAWLKRCGCTVVGCCYFFLLCYGYLLSTVA